MPNIKPRKLPDFGIKDHDHDFLSNFTYINPFYRESSPNKGALPSTVTPNKKEKYVYRTSNPPRKKETYF